MSDAEILECIKNTLKENKERFICGREVKRDLYYYALRITEPPILPRIHLNEDDIISNELITQKLKLKLLPGAAQENKGYVGIILKTKTNCKI